ncbi:MAG: stalk domain-containing protein [Syntrophomonadaceae bacterium]
MRIGRRINPLRSLLLRRPLLITIVLFWSFCMAPPALADTVVLTSPSNLMTSPISNTQIQLTWTDNSSNEIGYTVERRIGSGSYTVIANLVANSTTYTDSGLASGITYTYRVMAMGNGTNINSSGYSGESSAATTGASSSNNLATPGNLVATSASASQINLSWVDYATGESAYSVERALGSNSFSVIGYLSANSQNFSDVGLVSGNTYSYRVQAIGDGSIRANSAYSNIASAAPGSTATAVGAPTGLTATAVTNSQVNLSWVDNASGETGYNIERYIGSSGSFTLIASLGPNATAFSDTGLTVNTTYTYRVQVRNSTGNSSYSNEATVGLGTQVSEFLTQPSYIMATAISGSQINLVWTDNNNRESGYNVERKTADGTFSTVAYLAADVQSYSDLGLQEGTTYTYRIQARGNGVTVFDSTYSAEASATTVQAVAKSTVLRFFIGRMYYYLNDEGQFMDTSPTIQSNRTLLPISYAAIPLGIEVDWNQKEQKVTLTREGRIIQMWIGKNTASVNGVKVAIDAKNTKVAPTVVQGRTMVPMAFVALSLDCQVDWDAKTQEVKITYPKP